MEISITQEQGRVPVTVFHINGDIDAQTHSELEQCAREAIDSGTHYLLLDLANVPYVTSYGIRTISQIFSWLRDHSDGEDNASLRTGLRDGTFRSRHLKLVNVAPNVLKVLSSTGVDMFLEIHNDLKKAVASF